MRDTRERLEAILRQRIAVLDGSWGVLIQRDVRGEDAYRGVRRSITLSSDGTRRSFDVTIPAGVTDGQRIRLAGRGLPNPKGKAGDLYAEARIMVPARLSRAEKRLFEQLAAESDFDPRRQR